VRPKSLPECRELQLFFCTCWPRWRRTALQTPFGGVKESSTEMFIQQGASTPEFYCGPKTVHLDHSA
jgi:hypothetical protein